MSERVAGETRPKVRLLASPETTDLVTLRGWTDAPGNKAESSLNSEQMTRRKDDVRVHFGHHDDRVQRSRGGI
jgi:hypothetical protein